MFFSTLTLIVAVSTAFTITVLNFRYRQPLNTKMSKPFFQVFLVWIPWLLFMKRPGFTYKKRKVSTIEKNNDDVEENREDIRCIIHSLYSIPTEHLNLERKVGDGIFRKTNTLKPKAIQSLKSRRTSQFEKYMKKCIQEANLMKTSAYCEYTLTVVSFYANIHSKLKYIRERLDGQNELTVKQLVYIVHDYYFMLLVPEQWFLLLTDKHLVICYFYQTITVTMSERKINVDRSNYSVIDNEFGNMRERFEQEMRRVEDEMKRLRAEFEGIIFHVV
uniref:Neur_chan_memb domain-containing protein n=1 Tax=Heterorhabditis bacteriophora TaxID=37862 RepID=A0A1I7WZV9_HETBA